MAEPTPKIHPSAGICPCCETDCVYLRCPTCHAVDAVACPACTWHIDLPNLFTAMVAKLPQTIVVKVLREIAADRMRKETGP
ncbi:hypothetical protein LCGC14_0906890 [marine sediment metagenome]|uniref:Uncharacterized protein n=1 Tax=marine sediment metagenome TaxID=412755 RepID=A0A0F9NZE8_9ZZZZ